MEKVVKGDPEILEGEPVFPETRVPIESLFDHLEARDSSADFLEGFPSVEREQVLASLESRKGRAASRLSISSRLATSKKPSTASLRF